MLRAHLQITCPTGGTNADYGSLTLTKCVHPCVNGFGLPPAGDALDKTAKACNMAETPGKTNTACLDLTSAANYQALLKGALTDKCPVLDKACDDDDACKTDREARGPSRS